ncbi:MAG: hypothetical protein OXC08_16395 [Thiotrichales bacterium]|nr:hypothetical protein [Thiotrichales bacterium]
MTVTHRIPASEFPPLPPEGFYPIRVRARTDAGPGPASAEQRAAPVAIKEKRQVWLNGRWVRVDDAAVANALESIYVRATSSETETRSEAGRVTRLNSRLALEREARAAAIDALTVRSQEIDGRITTEANRITALDAVIEAETAARARALNALTTRVSETENGIESVSQEVTALEASIGGRMLGPAQNIFSGSDEAAAAQVRDAYGRDNPDWLAAYDAEDDINVELRWGVEYRFWRRVGGVWVANGEALARAAAVTNLNSTVIRQGMSITAQSESLTQLMAEVAGKAAATALQQLVARVYGDGPLGFWRVKTQIKDQVGSIGLVNDSDGVRVYVVANRFAVFPPGWTGRFDSRTGAPTGGASLPFAVAPHPNTGVATAFLNNAVIRDASIEGGKIKDATIKNAHIVDGTIENAKIKDSTITYAKITDRIQSEPFTATQGFRFDKSGAFILRGGEFRGDIQSSIFRTGVAGWRLLANGTAEIDAAAIRGILTAEHVDATNIQTVHRLWTGDAGIGPSGTTINLRFPKGFTRINDYESLLFVANDGSSYGTGLIPESEVSVGISRYVTPFPGAIIGTQKAVRVRSTSARTSVLLAAVSSTGFSGNSRVRAIYGLK